MIEMTDIYRSIRELLENNFSDIKVQTKDLKTPQVPCFYIKYITGVSKQTAIEFNNDTVSFEIIYFAEKEELKELLSVERRLKTLLNKPLKITLKTDADAIGYQYQETDSITFNLNEEDYVLHCNMTMNIDQSMCEGKSYHGTDYDNRYEEYDNDEYMEEIEI